MQLQTKLNITKGKFTLSYPSSILSVGSCFANNIYNSFHPLKFNILSNPFGVIYNPLSLFNSLLPINKNELFEKKIVERDDLFVHLDYHSDIRHNSKNDLIKLIENQHRHKDTFLGNAETLIITLGTAFYYRHKSDQQIVGNCHKIPSKNFDRLLFDINEIGESFEELVNYLKTTNPDIKIILTVSPVRHLRDGLEENNLSKSILRVFAHSAASAHDNVDYFPAFEIVNDELRDYRFYESDLIHPNKMATDYVIESFISTYFDLESLNSILAVKSIVKDLSHRPFNPSGLGYKKHLESILDKINSLERLEDFESEKKDLLERINS